MVATHVVRRLLRSVYSTICECGQGAERANRSRENGGRLKNVRSLVFDVKLA